MRPTTSISRSATRKREPNVGCASAGKRANASQQFRKSEGLYQIVVGARVEPQHSILNCVSGSQHQHRRFKAALAHRRQDLNSAAARKRHI